MAKHILDTDVCVHWLKGDLKVDRHIIAQGLENVFITSITECELHYGAWKSRKKEKNLSAIGELMKKLRILHAGPDTAAHYGRIKAGLEAEGGPLDDADLLIASIVLSQGGVLVTSNTEPYRRVPGLRVVDWS